MSWSGGSIATLPYWLTSYWWSVYSWCIGLCSCGSGSGGRDSFAVWLVGSGCRCPPRVTGLEFDSFGGVCGF